jgi:Na+-translocating ferredoxin:NAD+ oxidoreductase RnfC subunit
MRAYGSSSDMDELLASEAAQYAMFCCECGICEMYSCPMELQPCRINIVIKEEMRRRGVMPNLTEQVMDPEPSPDWPYRRIPSERMAARVEVIQYYEKENCRFEDIPCCGQVSIPLKMHAGVSAVPCVEDGSFVNAGDLIAELPQGSLGARIHGSISGRVRLAGDRIVIEAEAQ